MCSSISGFGLSIERLPHPIKLWNINDYKSLFPEVPHKRQTTQKRNQLWRDLKSMRVGGGKKKSESVITQLNETQNRGEERSTAHRWHQNWRQKEQPWQHKNSWTIVGVSLKKRTFTDSQQIASLNHHVVSNLYDVLCAVERELSVFTLLVNLKNTHFPF